MSEGTYTLLLALDKKTELEVGALGTRVFMAGWYAYTGSALGLGGFARIDRHRAVAAGENDTRHWHVDYLLGHPATTIESVARSVGVDAECEIARRLSDQRIAGFGASDCDCSSHLTYSPERERLWRAVQGVHRTHER